MIPGCHCEKGAKALPSLKYYSEKTNPIKAHSLCYKLCYLLWNGFLNQVHAGLWPPRAWFFKIDPVWIIGMRACVCVCVCVCLCVCVCVHAQSY